MLKFFSTKKSSVTLSKALELKEVIQDKIKSNYGILKLENSVLQGQERNYSLKDIVKENSVLQDQIIKIKLAIQQANLVIPEGEEQCISYNVYLLSEKKAQILNLQSMLKSAFEGTSTDTKGKSIVLAKPIYTHPELEDWINALKKECREIETKLTTLNNLIIVELPFKINLK